MRLIGLRCKHGDVKPADTNRSRAFPFVRVQIFAFLFNLKESAGVNGDEVPPVPFPNTEVKLICVEDTWTVTSWENISMPAFCFLFVVMYIYSSIAQSVEHAAVNRRVVGSSPTWGAKGKY